MSNQLQKTETGLTSFLNAGEANAKIEELLGSRKSSFVTSLVHIANSNELLKKAEPSSLLNAALLATTLDLPLNNSLGQAYIVPFNNKQKDGSFKVEAQFQLGAKGIQQLAIRSGQYSELESKQVFEGQVVEDDSFLGYHFNWRNKTSDKVIGYAAYFKLLSGFSTTFYMTVEEIEQHAKKYSQTYRKGFGNWKDDFDKMARKTVMKLLLNSGKAPLSIEMQKAIEADQSVINNYENDTIDVSYVDNSAETKQPVDKQSHEEVRQRIFLSTIMDKEKVKNIPAEELQDTINLHESLKEVTTVEAFKELAASREFTDAQKEMMKQKQSEFKKPK